MVTVISLYIINFILPAAGVPVPIEQASTLVIDGVAVDIASDRLWDETTYEAAMTSISLFQDGYAHRPDQHDQLADRYSEDVVSRAMAVGSCPPLGSPAATDPSRPVSATNASRNASLGSPSNAGRSVSESSGYASLVS